MATAPSTAPPRQKAYAAGVRITLFGLLTMTVDAVPQGRPNKREGTSFRSTCPGGHDEPTPVNQVYLCSEDLDVDRARLVSRLKKVGDDQHIGVADLIDLAGGHGPFQQWNLGSAREVDGKLVAVAKDEVVAAKAGDLEQNVMTVGVHPAGQVTAVTRPGGTGYRLRLPKKHAAAEARVYATVAALLASRDDVMLVGELRLQDRRALYRLDLHQGQIVVSELIHPEDLAAVDEQDDLITDDKLLGMINELVEAELVEFNPAAYRHDAEAAVAALMEAKANGETFGSVTSVTTDQGDVIDLLQARIDQARKKKAPAKKAAAKKVPAAKKTTRRRTAASA